MELKTIHLDPARSKKTDKLLKELTAKRDEFIIELSEHKSIVKTIKTNVQLLHNLN